MKIVCYGEQNVVKCDNLYFHFNYYFYFIENYVYREEIILKKKKSNVFIMLYNLNYNCL
jgi:hypothetical protein